jgi:hypothetical protein
MRKTDAPDFSSRLQRTFGGFKGHQHSPALVITSWRRHTGFDHPTTLELGEAQVPHARNAARVAPSSPKQDYRSIDCGLLFAIVNRSLNLVAIANLHHHI